MRTDVSIVLLMFEQRRQKELSGYEKPNKTEKGKWYCQLNVLSE